MHFDHDSTGIYINGGPYPGIKEVIVMHNFFFSQGGGVGEDVLPWLWLKVLFSWEPPPPEHPCRHQIAIKNTIRHVSSETVYLLAIPLIIVLSPLLSLIFRECSLI